MSDKPKIPRVEALAVAKELCAALKPLCEPERLIVAGSLRRGKEAVGDVEIVYVPRFEERADPLDLLGNKVQMNLVELWLQQCLDAGVLRKREREFKLTDKPGATRTLWGYQNKLAVHVASGIPVDFFGGTKENFWTLLVCRTGSAENNTRICNAAIARGLKWNPYAGFEDRGNGKLLYVPKSERDVFTRVGLEYREPNER